MVDLRNIIVFQKTISQPAPRNVPKHRHRKVRTKQNTKNVRKLLPRSPNMACFFSPVHHTHLLEFPAFSTILPCDSGRPAHTHTHTAWCLEGIQQFVATKTPWHRNTHRTTQIHLDGKGAGDGEACCMQQAGYTWAQCSPTAPGIGATFAACSSLCSSNATIWWRNR